MNIRKEIDVSKPLTAEQVRMLEEAEKLPVSFDEDCPELTDEQLSRAYRASKRNNQSVTVSLSPQSLEKAKSLGKSYPTILSQLLEKILNNNDLLKKCL